MDSTANPGSLQSQVCRAAELAMLLFDPPLKVGLPLVWSDKAEGCAGETIIMLQCMNRQHGSSGVAELEVQHDSCCAVTDHPIQEVYALPAERHSCIIVTAGLFHFYTEVSTICWRNKSDRDAVIYHQYHKIM